MKLKVYLFLITSFGLTGSETLLSYQFMGINLYLSLLLAEHVLPVDYQYRIQSFKTQYFISRATPRPNEYY